MKILMKLTYIVLMCAVLLGCLPLGAFAEEGTVVDGVVDNVVDGVVDNVVDGVVDTSAAAVPGPECFTYTLDEQGFATITSYTGSGNVVAIPDELDGRPVDAIGDGVFEGHTEIMRVDFGTSLKDIGDRAFKGCTKLETVILPSELQSIGTSAFEGCTSLYHLDVGSSLSVIDSNAFENCVSLDSIFLPETMQRIGDKAFSGCTSLKQLVIASASASFGSDIFSGVASVTVYSPAGSTALNVNGALKTEVAAGAEALTVGNALGGVEITAVSTDAKAIIVPEYIGSKRVVAIGDGAFSDLTSLAAVALPDSLRTIGKKAFSGDISLSCIRMPRTLTGNIGAETFWGCASLGRIYLPEGIETVGLNAFAGCKALTVVTFPESFSRIQSGAFYDCSSLRALIFWGDEPDCISKNSTADVVAFGSATSEMKIYTNSDRAWSSHTWYPNGKSGYMGFSVTPRTYDCFFVEHMNVFASCAIEGRSTLSCPFCGESYTKSYPVTEHNYVSMGASADTETFRCTGCISNYTVGLLSAAEITAETTLVASGADMIKSVTVTFRGEVLTEGVDYTCEVEYIQRYNRIKITVTGMGNYSGSNSVGYSSLTAAPLKTYTLTVIGASGSGTYYRDDSITLIPDIPTPEGKEAVWTIEGGTFRYATNDSALLEMPAKNVTVTLTYKDAPVTTPPVTTAPPPVTTPPVTTEPPPVTMPPVTTEPPVVTTPPVTTEPVETTTTPYSATPGGQQYLTRAMIWAMLLFVSLAAFVVLCIMMFRAERKKKG